MKKRISLGMKSQSALTLIWKMHRKKYQAFSDSFRREIWKGRKTVATQIHRFRGKKNPRLTDLVRVEYVENICLCVVVRRKFIIWHKYYLI